MVILMPAGLTLSPLFPVIYVLNLFWLFPRLTTAMYMGYLGVFQLMEGDIPVLWNSQIFDMNSWMIESTQYYAWGMLLLWQYGSLLPL